MCLQRPRNQIYLITTIQVNTLQLFTGVERPSKKILRPKPTSVKLKKRLFFRLSKPIIGASFFKKWQILHFPAIKTDWWVVGCSNYYQLIALVISKWKHMHLKASVSMSKKAFLTSVTYKILKNSFFWHTYRGFQMQIQHDLSVIDPRCAYVFTCLWLEQSIGSN